MVRSLLLLLCLATLTVSVDSKKCRDKKTAKGCVKKRAKNFCQEESSCPKLKKGGKKCKKTRKSCRLTCGLCTPGVDSLTNQPIGEVDYEEEKVFGNGEEACQGHGYGKASCEEVGCCQYAECSIGDGSGECHSAVGPAKCTPVEFFSHVQDTAACPS